MSPVTRDRWSAPGVSRALTHREWLTLWRIQVSGIVARASKKKPRTLEESARGQTSGASGGRPTW